MIKQHAEKIFREFFKKKKLGHIEKIQVNPYAHRRTAGDFFCQTKNYDIVVECKEIKIDSVFDTHRLTQLKKLKEFSNRYKRNQGIIYFLFWGGSKKKSKDFFLEVNEYAKLLKHFKKRTLKLSDFELLTRKKKINCSVLH